VSLPGASFRGSTNGRALHCYWRRWGFESLPRSHTSEVVVTGRAPNPRAVVRFHAGVPAVSQETTRSIHCLSSGVRGAPADRPYSDLEQVRSLRRFEKPENRVRHPEGPPPRSSSVRWYARRLAKSQDRVRFSATAPTNALIVQRLGCLPFKQVSWVQLPVGAPQLQEVSVRVRSVPKGAVDQSAV
jgi:hypothetical protein